MNRNTKINAALDERAVVQSGELPWVDSPAAGIQRKMLESDSAEVGRANSIVRAASGSRFATHLHQLSEKILVLGGTLGDDNGSYGPVPI